MTPETCKKLLEQGILQAFAEGKIIQFKEEGMGNWMEPTNRNRFPDYEWRENYEYRIKPEFQEGDLVMVQGLDEPVILGVEQEGGYTWVNDHGNRYTVLKEAILHKVKEEIRPWKFHTAIKAIAERSTEVRLKSSLTPHLIVGIQTPEKGEELAFTLELGEFRFRTTATNLMENYIMDDGSPCGVKCYIPV